jgi:hypothetical protein
MSVEGLGSTGTNIISAPAPVGAGSRRRTDGAAPGVTRDC